MLKYSNICYKNVENFSQTLHFVVTMHTIKLTRKNMQRYDSFCSSHDVCEFPESRKIYIEVHVHNCTGLFPIF